MGVSSLPEGRAIECVGTYVPRYRITAETVGDAWDGFRARGVEAKRVPAGDEDAVTMAVAAARDALAESTYARSDVGTLALGTTTPPVDEGDVAATVAEILGLDPATETSVFTQSTRAGTRALVAGLRAAPPALVVAADCPQGEPGDAVEHAAGAGAVALVVGETGAEDASEGYAPVTDLATYTEEFAGTRFRRRGTDAVETYDATAYERDAYTTAVAGAVEGLAATPDALAPTATDGSLPGRAGRAVGDVDVYQLATDLGDTGAASPLFGLVGAWADGADDVAVVGFGDGAGADAVAVEGCIPVDADWPATDVTYAEYLRKRGHVGGEH